MLSRILLAIADYFIKLVVGRTLNKVLPTVLKNVDIQLTKLPEVTAESVRKVIINEILEETGEFPTIPQYNAVLRSFDIEKAATTVAENALKKLF